ncbi:MAG: hypothetical protein ACPGU1_03875 [Myxococcota bacterium]
MSSSHLSLAILTSLLMLTGSAMAQSDQQVIWIEGPITVKQVGERRARPVELQPTDPVHGKLRVVVPAEGALWLLKEQRELIGLHGPGTWEVSLGTPLHGEGRVTRIPVNDLQLSQPAVVPWVEVDNSLRGTSRATPTSPTETAVTTRRPVLRWRNEPGVLRIDLTLIERNAEGQKRLVETWQGLTGTHHEVRRPLTPGYDYAWRVQTERGGAARSLLSTESDTWFHVLSDAAIQSARRADAAVSRLQLDHPKAAKALNVLRALAWERHGLAKEAQRAWDEITEDSGQVEALRLYRARLALRALARPRSTVKKAPPTSEPKRP